MGVAGLAQAWLGGDSLAGGVVYLTVGTALGVPARFRFPGLAQPAAPCPPALAGLDCGMGGAALHCRWPRACGHGPHCRCLCSPECQLWGRVHGAAFCTTPVAPTVSSLSSPFPLCGNAPIAQQGSALLLFKSHNTVPCPAWPVGAACVCSRPGAHTASCTTRMVPNTCNSTPGANLCLLCISCPCHPSSLASCCVQLDQTRAQTREAAVCREHCTHHPPAPSSALNSFTPSHHPITVGACTVSQSFVV